MSNPNYILDNEDDIWQLVDKPDIADPYYLPVAYQDQPSRSLSYIRNKYGPCRELLIGGYLKEK